MELQTDDYLPGKGIKEGARQDENFRTGESKFPLPMSA
jgi:hypothetical protein